MGDTAIWLGVLGLAIWTVWRITESPSEPTYPEDTTMATTHVPIIRRISDKPPAGPFRDAYTEGGPGRVRYEVDWQGVPVVEGDTVLMSVEIFERCIAILNGEETQG